MGRDSLIVLVIVFLIKREASDGRKTKDDDVTLNKTKPILRIQKF
jgi:hypothetical protein